MSTTPPTPENKDPADQGDGKGTRYSPELWKAIQQEWESNPTMSYAAAVKVIGERLGVPVPSKGACATYAKRNNWTKGGGEHVQDAPASTVPDGEHVQEFDEQVAGPAEHVQTNPEHDDPTRANEQERPAASKRAGRIPVSRTEVADEVVDDDDGLTGKQRRFADEYLIDLNATAAYKRAGYDVTGNVAEAAASRLLSNVKVQAYISKRQAELQATTEITQEMVLKRWWDIAAADPNEIVEYRRMCCRHCWGIAFAYQWTKEEFEKATRKHLLDCTKAKAKDQPEPEPPDGAGGDGYDRKRPPNPECPECGGDGFGWMHVHDTRRLTGAARLLYAGMKATKQGLEPILHDQLRALDAVSRHIGFYNDKLEVSGAGFDLAELEKRFAERMASARARTAALIQERKQPDSE